jgi:hypothetical protein
MVVLRIPICPQRQLAPVDINQIAAHGSNVVAGGESGREEYLQDAGATPRVSHEPPQTQPAAIFTSGQRLSASSADATISTAVASPSPTGTRGLAVTLSYLGRIEEVAPSTEAAMAAADAAHHPFWSAAMRTGGRRGKQGRLPLADGRKPTTVIRALG